MRSGHLEKTVKFSPKCGWDSCTKSSSKFFCFCSLSCNVAVFVMNVIRGKVNPITCEGQEGE